MTLFQLMQFYYLVSGSARLTDRAERTALLMNRFFLCELDEQLERTIEQQTTMLSLDNFSVETYGMYRIDYTLMYSAVSTITCTLIVMIQFQLTE
ncbi:putative gustatory receptor 28a isoform X1 [Culex pipiens pallens]|uniref:putative gustatory receptor 28a isoform X1 n=1 Tax=Culex pipiens pallens TaxID=42434 RepID=UPI001953759E|nr:putative gustatory receptor 28a isoform X1 [Culex pipiens pallens]